tara:strand:- start:14 stop:1759 length:1746 start_codon:yes stop_codon:yes gene_type:complete
MADDTPQRMIDAMKREQQPQAFAKRYKNYEEPRDPDTGLEMTDEQRTKWRASIDEREAIPAQIQRKLPRWAKDYVQDPIEDMKETAIEGGKGVYRGLDSMATDILQYPVKVARDPLGEAAKIEQATVDVAKGVASGDYESQRTALDVAGALPIVGEAADATSMGLDLKEGDYVGAGISGAALALPFVSAGMLKQTFKSVLEETIPKLKDKTGVDSLIPALTNKGVKKAEIEALRLPEFIAEQKAKGAKSISKADLIRHVNDNQLVVGEQIFDSRAAKGSPNQPSIDFTGEAIMPGGEDAKDILVTVRRPGSKVTEQFVDPDHYKVADEAVRIRTSTRYDHAGRKILFIDEVQSDHAQALRARGKNKAENLQKRAVVEEELRKLKYGNADDINAAYNGGLMSRAENIALVKQLRDLERLRANIKKGPVPDAIFADTDQWTDLGIKRAMSEAAEGGYDGIAFTKGSIAEEYSDFPADSAEYYYDKIVPSRLKKIAGKNSVSKTVISPSYYAGGPPPTKKLDPKYWDRSRANFLDTDGEEFTFVELTPDVREKAAQAKTLFTALLAASAGSAGVRATKNNLDDE